MSWGIGFIATTKQAAFDEIERLQHAVALPEEAANAINAVLTIIPEPPAGRGLSVESNGHIDTYGARAEVKIDTYKSLVIPPTEPV